MDPINPADLIDSTEVAVIVRVAHRESVSMYRRRWPDFPEPVIEKGRCVLWLRSDIEAWARKHPGKKRT